MTMRPIISLWISKRRGNNPVMLQFSGCAYQVSKNFKTFRQAVKERNRILYQDVGWECECRILGIVMDALGLRSH